jgi:hypothetical protein
MLLQCCCCTCLVSSRLLTICWLLPLVQVENGKGAMPAWAGRLDDDEIQAVAEYVYKQALDKAW